MSKFFLAIYDYLSRHKILAAAILVVCVGLSVWLSLLLHYEENITDFLPKSKENAKYTSVYESIGDQGRITLIFRADTSLADSEDKKYSLMDAVDAFEENWYKYAPDSVDVDLQCHTDESAVFDALDFLRDNVAIFLTDDDYDRIDSLLSIDGYVDTCMQNVKRMLSFPMSSSPLRVACWTTSVEGISTWAARACWCSTRWTNRWSWGLRTRCVTC